MNIGGWIWFFIIFILSIGYVGAELGEQRKSYKIFMGAFNSEKVIIKEKKGLEERIKKTKLILWIFFNSNYNCRHSRYNYIE